MMTPLRVAAFQRRPLFGDLRGTTARILSDLAWCESEGVRLALFPECYLQGYVLEREALAENAIALDGPEARLWLDALAPADMTCVLGVVERRGSAIFNTALVIRQGRIIGLHRKTRLHRKEAAFAPGNALSTFAVDAWQFGINICYEANFPELAAALAVQGVRLICYPLNNMLPPDVAERWRPKSIRNLQERAAETGCWIVSADVVGMHQNMICHGCTRIVSPTGDEVGRVAEGCEGVAVFDLHD
jgi:predicted amidohydrolase